MYISDLCNQSKYENKYVLVSFMDMTPDESGIDFDAIEPVFDKSGSLVGYLLFSEGLGEFHPKESIRWFMIKNDNGGEM